VANPRRGFGFLFSLRGSSHLSRGQRRLAGVATALCIAYAALIFLATAVGALHDSVTIIREALLVGAALAAMACVLALAVWVWIATAGRSR